MSELVNTDEILGMVTATHRVLEELSDNYCELQVKCHELSRLMKDFEKLYRYNLEERLQVFNKEYGYIIRALGFEDEDGNDPETPCSVYYIFNKEKDKVKIGISNNPLQRAKSLQTACGEEISVLHTINFPSREEAFKAEQFLHREFSQFRKKPSKVTNSCEWFDASIVDDLMKYYDTEEHINAMRVDRAQSIKKAMDSIHIGFGKEE